MMVVAINSSSDKYHDSNGLVFVPLNLERVQQRLSKVLGKRHFNAASNLATPTSKKDKTQGIK